VHHNRQSPNKHSLSGLLMPDVCSCRLGYGTIHCRRRTQRHLSILPFLSHSAPTDNTKDGDSNMLHTWLLALRVRCLTRPAVWYG
jgi:hypothetical protein